MLFEYQLYDNFFVYGYAQKHSINNLLGFGTQKQTGPAQHEVPTGNAFLQYSPALQSESVIHPWLRWLGSIASTGRSGSTA